MIIAHEENAPCIEVREPFKRKLKVLLSPALHPELKSIAAGLTVLPPGGRSDSHKHEEGEMFYVLSGHGLIRIGDEEERMIPGTAVWGPSGVCHQLVNNCDENLKILWVLSPPGRERIIIEKSKCLNDS